MNISKKIVLAALCGLAGWNVAGQETNTAARIHPSKWLSDEKGYLEARELQQRTGADIVIYFANYALSDEKGLCRWWENKGLQDGKVGRLLRDYIKVKVELPFRNKASEEAFSSFRFNKTPAVFIIRPTGFPQRIHVFDWTEKQPRLKSSEDLVNLFTESSSTKTPDEK